MVGPTTDCVPGLRGWQIWTRDQATPLLRPWVRSVGREMGEGRECWGVTAGTVRVCVTPRKDWGCAEACGSEIEPTGDTSRREVIGRVYGAREGENQL